MRSVRERQQRANVSRVERRDRADLDEARLARDRRPARRRVTLQAAWEWRRWAGWASCSPNRSAQEQEARRGSRAAARRRRRRPAASRSAAGGCSASSALRFSNLPRRAGGARATSTSWRERAQLGAALAPRRRARRAHDRRATRTRAARRRRARPGAGARGAGARRGRAARRRRGAAPRAGRRRSRAPARKSGARRARAPGRSAASRRRPALWAAMTGPLAQRRRGPCTQAAGEHAQLARERPARCRAWTSKRRLARPRARAARAQRAQPRVVAGAPVVERRPRRRSGCAGRRRRAAGPATPARRRRARGARRSGPTRSKRGAADRHVRAPRVRRVRSARPRSRNVTGGPSRPHIGSAWSSMRATIGPVKHVDVGLGGGGRRAARASQPGRTATSSSTNATQLAVGLRDAGVARRVQAARRVVRDIARAAALGATASRRRVRSVVDHERPRRPPRAPAARSTRSATSQVARAVARRDDDGDGAGPRSPAAYRGAGACRSVAPR